MKTITTLSALLFTACTVPGLQMGSTLSTSGTGGSAPAATSSTAATTASAAPTPDPAAASEPAAAPDPASVHAAPAAPALTSRDVDPINDAAQWVAEINDGSLAPGHGTRESELRDRVMYCSQQVANLIAHDYPRSATLPLTHGEATLGDADAKICQALAKNADGWDSRAKQFYAARNDATLEPYRKAGVSGDKLELVNDLGKQLIGPGHAEATPSIVAGASVLFSVRDEGPRPDGGHDWTIVRYAFSGNKQIAVTEKGYHAHPGPDAYR